jgi:mRNA interferase RelE/StbE
MPWQIEFSAKAARQFGKLSRGTQERLLPHIDALAVDQRPPGCKKLKGHGDFWRIRVGDYRIIYQIYDRALIVLIVTVGDQKDVYQ